MSRHRLNRSLRRLQRTLLSQKYGILTSMLATSLKLTPFTGDQVERWDPWLIRMSWFLRILFPNILLIVIICAGLAYLYVLLDNHFGLRDEIILFIEQVENK